jgi:alkylation response protein AidB-like acyl-CoA dehydrogenase
MDLSLSPEQVALRGAVRQMMKQVASEEVLIAQQQEGTGYMAPVWDQLCRSGWIGLGVPEAFGGSGAPMSDFAVLLEEYGRGPLPELFAVACTVSPALILECGTQAQRERWLPVIAEGRERVTVALTDSDGSWQPRSTGATLQAANGTYFLSGHTRFVPDMAGATKVIVAAQYMDTKGIALVMVDPASPGVDYRLMDGLVQWQSSLTLNDVEIAREDILGAPGNDSWPAIKRAVLWSIPLICAYQVGSCQSVFELALEHSKTRIQFGQPVGRFQRVQDHIVELVNYLDSARWATYETLWKWDTRSESAGASTYMTKAIVSEAHWEACNYAHEVHGGIGVDITYGLAKHTYLSRSLYHFAGDPRANRREMADALGW